MAAIDRSSIPKAAFELAEAFSKAGFRVWLVGGWVRDALLGRTDADLDFATDARPDESLKVLKEFAGGRVWTTGMEFGTVGAQLGTERVEVTTFRKEVYHRETRNPTVEFADDVETDLSRRDFTVNAIAISLPTLEVIDPFGGRHDLSKGLIKTPRSPQESFTDDPLRMLRALRFVSTLGFEVEASVLQAISEMGQRLEIVSAERIREEFSRLILGDHPAAALEMATATSLAQRFLPELPELKLAHDPLHRHKDVFRHTLAVMENAISLEPGNADLVLRLAALLHDVGKPKTRRFEEGGAVSFHHHEVVGAKMVKARLKALRFPTKTTEEVSGLVYLHLRFHTYRMGWSDSAVRRYVRDAGAQLGRLNALVRADCTTRNPDKARRLAQRMDELEARIAKLAAAEELMALRPALDGTQVMAHLGIEPGRQVGEALDFLMEIRMEDGEIPEQEAYERLDEWWSKRGSNP